MSSFLLRYAHFAGYSAFRGGWEVGFVYPVTQILGTGHLPEFVQIPRYSGFTASITSQLDNPFSAYTSAIFMLVVSPAPTEMLNAYLRYGLWVGVLAYPLAIVFLAKRLTHHTDKLQGRDFLLLYLFAALGNYTLVSGTDTGINTTQFGTLFLVLVFLFAATRPADARFRLLLLLSAVAVIGYYHTTAGVMVILLVVSYLVEKLAKRNTINSVALVLMLTIFFGYYLYLFLPEFSQRVTYLARLVFFGRTYGENILSGSEPVWWLILYISNALSIGIPALIFMFAKIRNLRSSLQEPATLLALSWILALPVIALAVVSWGGIVELILRLSTYVGIVASIVAVMWLANMSRAMRRKILSIVVIVAMATSVLTYVTSDSAHVGVASASGITLEEWGAGEWSSARVPASDFVFTDYRLTGPFMLGDHLKTVGVTGAVGESTATFLEDVYYSENSSKAEAVLQMFGVHYLFFSNRMSDIGITTTFLTYRPPSQDFQRAYDQMSPFDKIYANGEATLYYIGG